MFWDKNYVVHAACSCQVGKVRTNNEDNLFFDGFFLPKDNCGLEGVLEKQCSAKEMPLFGVFDGMGGEAFGEEASFAAAEIWSIYAKNHGREVPPLREMCLQANETVCRIAYEKRAGMVGSTVVSLAFSKKYAYMVNLGDSKAFLLRNRQLSQISVDHTNEEWMKQHSISRKPYLTQHLGIDPTEMLIEPYVQKVSIAEGDIYLLCSDGLTDMVSLEDITHILDKEKTVADHTKELVDKALQNGGRDNVTVILCRVECK